MQTAGTGRHLKAQLRNASYELKAASQLRDTRRRQPTETRSTQREKRSCGKTGTPQNAGR